MMKESVTVIQMYKNSYMNRHAPYILLSLFVVSVDVALVLRPSNTVAVTGERVVFNCSTNLTAPIYWARKLNLTGDIEAIYQSDTMVDKHVGRMEVIKTAGDRRYDLVILNVTLNDSANYYCVDDDNTWQAGGNQDKGHAELTVTGLQLQCADNLKSSGMVSGHLCDINFDPDVITVTCSLEFRGIIPPVLQWHGLSERVNSLDVTNSTADGKLRNVLTAQVKREMNGSSIECCLVSHCSLVKWTSRKVKVLHVARPVYPALTPHYSQWPVEEFCSVMNNLDGVSWYRWIKDGSKLIAEVNRLLLTVESEERYGLYECWFYCSVRGEIGRVKVMSVNITSSDRKSFETNNTSTVSIPSSPDQGSCSYAFNWILLGGQGLLGLVMVVLWFAIYRLWRSTRGKPGHDSLVASQGTIGL